ncbi:hypothetical protein LSTR_LSTR001831 [Laodelphax striatellus]|uniref:Cytoskeleton-associated protein 2 C-terminal domain-containing protein n=1 Tax=Laodelphax striatellus TaxID=195883 RepID=A0A482WFV6_LAOST|nr:hypothetical protein LSTR_LSTR001831 [Laodelphax striatellus]
MMDSVSVKEERRELIHKWREERKRKLIARLFRNNPLGPATTSSPLSSAILGIKPSGSASANTSSQQKSYQQPPKSNNFRKSLALLKDGKGRVEKRHTMNPAYHVNTQTLHKIGKSVQNQNNCFQKNKDTMAKDSRLTIMKKYDEDRKKLMRRTLAAIENTKSTLQSENNKGNDEFDTKEDTKDTKDKQNVDGLQVVKDNNSKDELNDGNAAGNDGLTTGEDLNTTFTLPNGESLSPIRGTNQDSAMTGGTRRLSSTPLKSSTPEEKYMSEKLSSWLKTKGKSVEGFAHLKCFLHHKKGSAIPIRQPFKTSNSGPLRISVAPKPRPTNLPAIVIETIKEEEENSRGDLTIDIENAELPCSPTKEHDEAASADCNPADETTVVLDSANLKETTVKALHELLTLIHTGYPWESCKEWLTALRSRNPDAESLPDYWECLAALEEVQGDMQMAVDSYQRALMRGAEVSHIDTCLDSLFEKMNALNLECQPYTPRQVDGKKKTCVDAKNIFKSSVIQFALLQQKVKTFSSESGVGLNNLNYIATPVRRSTRQSLFTSKTPQRCTSSIKNLMSEEKENVQFKPNKALLFDD